MAVKRWYEGRPSDGQRPETKHKADGIRARRSRGAVVQTERVWVRENQLAEVETWGELGVIARRRL